MRVVLVSDTHNQFSKIKVPDGDILIHAGDATGSGTLMEIIELGKVLRALPHLHKVFIPGNHDWLFERDLDLAREIIGSSTIVLVDQEITLEGLRIYGSPWTPRFYNWAFNLDRGEYLLNRWKRIPEDIDILVTHGPPYTILDRTEAGEHVGCEDLRDQLVRIRPKLHVFGHIHEAYGVLKCKNTFYINACICDEDYRPSNPPIVFDYDGRSKIFTACDQ